MPEHPVLAQLALGHAPMIDRQRAVIATRLSVFPLRPDAAPETAALLDAVCEVFPPGGPPLLLNLAGESWLQALLRSEPPPHVMIEVPAFAACDPANAEALAALHTRGNRLLVKGRPAAELPPAVLSLFTHSLVEGSEERRTAPPAAAVAGQRRVTTVRNGVRTFAEAATAFEQGAVAVLGWPLDDPIPAAPAAASGKSRNVAPDVSAIMELINRVDRQEPVDRLEAVLKNDPTLAFRLVRYINAPAFGLKVEIGSFRHALMMLGYQRLKRWLSLLLASSAKDANAKPLMHAAVRRGLLMEELVRHSADDEMRGEMFVCGVFSLLDRLLRQPMAELLKSVPAPERVSDALLERGGPFGPYLELVRAVENESPWDLREAADRVFLSPAEVNRALLRALASAQQLE